MNDETRPMSVEYLLRMRGDLALATLETMLVNMKKMTETMDAVFQQMKMLEEHYQLNSSTGKTPLGDLAQTLRQMAGGKLDGATDEEVLAYYNKNPIDPTK